jgi:heme A synthase
MKHAQWLAWATAFATLILIAVGVLVRATGSGLGCPDWPTCHGGALPPGGNHHAAIEMSHRFVASLVGFMVIAVAIYAWKYFRHSPVVLWTAILTVPLVGLQGLLGALAVVRELPPEVVATHLLTAMIVLSFELVVAIGMTLDTASTRATTMARAQAAFRSPGFWALAAIGWLSITLWVGGYMTESGGTTACDGWPLCNGSILPANDDQEITHMAHRYLAGLFVFFIAAFVVSSWKRRDSVPWAAGLAIASGVLYVVQVALGAINIWTDFPEPLTISHTVIASLIWFTLSSAVTLALYRPVEIPERVGPLTRGEAPA